MEKSKRLVSSFTMATTDPDTVFRPGKDTTQRVTFYAKGPSVRMAFEACLEQMREHGLYDVDEFQTWADVQANVKNLETLAPAGVVLSVS